MTVRPVICRVTDEVVPQLVAIEAHANTPPWSARLFSQEFQNNFARVYGARYAGSIVGFLVCHVILDEAHVLNFAVEEQMRDQGVGKQLLQHVMRELAHESVKWITLEVRASNTRAQHLYAAFGFFEVGIRPRYYSSNQEDAVVMRADLINFVDRGEEYLSDQYESQKHPSNSNKIEQ